MNSKAYLAAFLVTMSASAIGCAVDSSTPQPTTSSSKSSEDPLLKVTEAEGKVSGTYAHAAGVVSFEITEDSKDVYAVTVKERGLTLDATVNRATGASSFDGFATDNGGNTQMTKEDLPLLIAAEKAIGAHFADSIKAGNQIGDTLSRTMETWAEWPTTLQLGRRVLGEEGRSYNSYCGQMHGSQFGPAVSATHDCCTHWYDPCTSHSRGSSNSSVVAYLGDYNTGSTYHWSGSNWDGSGIDHWSWPTEYGDCYGRCGADCGSGHAYTQDCHDHDSCVRNGHWIGSPYCDDEFSSTLDDALYAPNCY